MTSGNSRTTTFTLGLSASRKEAGNKFALDAGAAYARSSILVFQDTNGNGAIDRGELRRQDQTTANSWFTKARYDRFLSEHNSAYLSALASADQPAGKDFVGGGQIGYSRQLFKTDQHELVAELGYDLSYESYLTPVDSSVTIHSARIFVGHTSKLTDATSAFANVEALLNLNSESTLNADDDTGMTKTVDPLSDTRVNIKAGLTTTLWKNISFSFGFTLKYDHNPAPLPAPKGAPAYAAGFQPFADTVDTITEAALIVNFL
ncbi:MAG TPA: DUF481 domain-containing protein [Polyangia bacterium]|nr:DUF481 domain-containing protein [Polyangia bacterium]